MTPDEHEIVKMEIELSVTKAMSAFTTTNDDKMDDKISDHEELCKAQRGNGCSNDKGLTLGWIAANWRTLTVAGIIMAFAISSVVSAIRGTPQKFTPEMVKQIAQQVQEQANPANTWRGTAKGVIMIKRFKKWLRRNTVRVDRLENARGHWQWRLKASNGETLAHSEEYTSWTACNDTMKSLIGKTIA